jgi:hypothetical protein
MLQKLILAKPSNFRVWKQLNHQTVDICPVDSFNESTIVANL